jgi:hypothetical protein
VSEATSAARSLLSPLERQDVPALARLTRVIVSSWLRRVRCAHSESFTDEGQEGAVLETLQVAKNGTELPMVIVDARGNLVGTSNCNSIIRGAFQSASRSTLKTWPARSPGRANGLRVAAADATRWSPGFSNRLLLPVRLAMTSGFRSTHGVLRFTRAELPW